MTPASGPELEQRRIGLAGDAEERLVGEEHDHELRRGLELLPVPLRAELRDVVAHLARVRLHVRPARVLVLRLERVEVRGQGRLRVDDDVLAAGQLDDEVGPQHAPVGVRDRRLLGEVAVREHSGKLDHALELDLAPAAAHVRRAERRAEVSRLGAELLLPLRQRLHLLGQATRRHAGGSWSSA